MNTSTTARIPVWVRVSGIIALVLVGTIASAMLVGAAGIGGGSGPMQHGPGGGQNPPTSVPAPGGPGGHTPPRGGH